MREKSRFLLYASLFVGLIAFCALGAGPLPPLGRLLSFSEGVYVNARQKPFSHDTFKAAELKDKVTIVIDRNQVPHIFAQNESDLFFAQGHLMAKYRLWQMDMSTRAGGAQLSEVLGEKTQDLDRFFIQIGLRKASEDSFLLAQKDSKMMGILESYTKGINSYIKSLTYKDWPTEYKVVNARPQLFTEQRVIQLLKIMSFNLAARSYDLTLTEIVKKLGWKRSIDLFPDHYSRRLDFDRFDDLFHDLQGETNDLKSLQKKPFLTQFDSFPDFLLPFHTDGSNSWVIHKKKTKNGHNILANDTHLSLTAPPVWFENRLFVEDQLDVYGASFPGAPTVIVGFNKNLAWGATNGTIDVVDWFEIEFKSDTSTEYLLDGQWENAIEVKSELKVRGRPTQTITTLWTTFGPVVHREGPLGLAVQWVAHQPSNEAKVFYKMNKTQSVEQAHQELKNFQTPLQNFSLVDKEHIAIFSAGRLPKKVYGFGRIVENGRLSQNRWSEFYQGASQLYSVNPQEGFLHSANQRPLGSDFFSYLGWDFEEPYRGLRIRELLQNSQNLTAEDSLKMQNESFNELAFYFFKIVDREELGSQFKNSWFTKLKNWDLKDDPEDQASTLFYSWFQAIEQSFWAQEFQFQETKYYPKKSRTLIELFELKKKDKRRFHIRLKETFKKAIENLTKSSSDPQNWIWGKAQPTLFRHVTRFPGFESSQISPPGSRYSLNSNKGHHGGAWRLVVEMSDPIRAFSQVPGSVVGNPLRPEYSSNIKEWAQGQFHEVQFLQKKEILKQALGVMEFAP